MDWGAKKQSLKNKTLKKKSFQGLRNWYANTKSSIKNYFAKKKANKEGRVFRPTMKAKEARERMERYAADKRHSQGAYVKKEEHEELTPENIKRLEEVNVEALPKSGIPLGNDPYINTELPIKNSLKDAKEHVRLAKANMREIQVFDSRLKEKKFLFEKQQLIKSKEQMLQENIEAGREHLDEAAKAARKVLNSPKTPEFKKNDANELFDDIDDLQRKFDNYFLYFDSMYEYSHSMARRNVEQAIYKVSKRSENVNISKAINKLRATNNNVRPEEQILANTELLGEYREKLRNLRDKMERRRRVETMGRGKGGATRKHKHKHKH